MFNKEQLAELIYKIHSISSFRLRAPIWSSPVVGFLYDNSLPSKFMRALSKDGLIFEGTDAVICVLGDWEEVDEGIIFTDRALYVNSPKNTDKNFKVRYDDITGLEYLSSIPKLNIKTGKRTFSITTDMWSKRNIHDFLQFVCEKYEFDSKRKEEVLKITLQSASSNNVGALASGITYGDISNASSLYFDDKIVSPRGHGFAAEHANHLADIYHGRDARIVGDDNAKNGADRIVDSVQIQSKYCATGSRCIQECFENGKFRYWNPDGTPMQIEVPSDMYEAAVQAMENRIRNNEVAGITDPKEAANIVRKGHFTYAQVKNIAKAGTVESIGYDAASGAIISGNAFGITAVLTFATALWDGESVDVALKSAAAQGLKVGGVTFVSAVLAGQLSKAGLNSLLVGSSEAIVNALGPKASAFLINAFRSGTNIHGTAAMKSLAKLLRINVITGAITFTVLSIGDVGNIFLGRISGGQLFKNISKTASTVASGGGGWAGGAFLGTLIAPGIGTTIGGIIGSLVGGAAASGITGAVLDQFIEDDADRMVKIIQEVFAELAGDYLTTQQEAEKIVDKLQATLTGDLLKDMFASSDRRRFARELMEEYFKDAAFDRKHILLPTTQQMQNGLKQVLEDLAEQSELESTKSNSSEEDHEKWKQSSCGGVRWC